MSEGPPASNGIEVEGLVRAFEGGVRCVRDIWRQLGRTPGRSVLVSGEKLEFRSRFVSPPDNAVDVMERFINAQDATCKPARVGK